MLPEAINLFGLSAKLRPIGVNRPEFQAGIPAYSEDLRGAETPTH